VKLAASLQAQERLTSENQALDASCRQLKETLVSERAAHDWATKSFNQQLDEAKQREERLFDTNQMLEKELQCAREAMQAERLNHQQALNECSERLNSVGRTAEHLQRDNTTLADEVTRLGPSEQQRYALQQSLREREAQLEDSRSREQKALERQQTMEHELESVFQKLSAQLDSARVRELSLMEENQQVRLAMAAVDSAHKELGVMVKDSKADNTRLQSQLDMARVSMLDQSLTSQETKLSAEMMTREASMSSEFNEILARQRALTGGAYYPGAPLPLRSMSPGRSYLRPY